MTPFNPKSVCPKCACISVSAQHRPPWASTATPHPDYAFDARIFGDDRVFASDHEHVLRKCNRCDFPWIERCARIDEVAAVERGVEAAYSARAATESARLEAAEKFIGVVERSIGPEALKACAVMLSNHRDAECLGCSFEAWRKLARDGA